MENFQASRTLRVQKKILRWFRVHGRNLPWRQTRNPYKILVSEIMLHQTQVDHVIPRYLAFLKKFPDIDCLARAPLSDVIVAWRGLGYNRRALNLHKTAIIVVQQYHGKIPNRLEELESLPGIGRYTARILQSFIWNRDQAALDTNIRRVTHRVFVGPEIPSFRKKELELLSLAQSVFPRGRGRIWNHALMDFGALVCTAKQPRCQTCPLNHDCRSAFTIQKILPRRSPKQARAEPAPSSTPKIPNRIYRGRIIEALREDPQDGISTRSLGKKIKPDYSLKERPWLFSLLRGLVEDGLITMRTNRQKTVIRLP